MPLACKASALPFELHHHVQNVSQYYYKTHWFQRSAQQPNQISLINLSSNSSASASTPTAGEISKKGQIKTNGDMDFQVVVLAGGTSKKLVPLVSKEVPKSLLPVANRPVLSYVLELLEQSNLKDLIVVVEGEDAALLIGGWISSTYVDRLHVELL